MINLGNGLPPNFSGKKMLNEKNTFSIPRVSGVYRLYNTKNKRLYVGVAKKGDIGNLRHRIQSYRQEDNYDHKNGHPEKKALRGRVTKFDFCKMSIKEAREFESVAKHKTPYNRNHLIQKKMPNGKTKNFFIEEKHVKTHHKNGKVSFKKSVTKRKGLSDYFG